MGFTTDLRPRLQVQEPGGEWRRLIHNPESEGQASWSPGVQSRGIKMNDPSLGEKDQLCTSLRALSRPSADQSHYSLGDGGSSLSVHRLKGQSPPYSYPETTLYQLLEYPIIQAGWSLKLSTTVFNIMLNMVNTHKLSCLTHLFG